MHNIKMTIILKSKDGETIGVCAEARGALEIIIDIASEAVEELPKAIELCREAKLNS